jgi:hypothetical protein
MHADLRTENSGSCLFHNVTESQQAISAAPRAAGSRVYARAAAPPRAARRRPRPAAVCAVPTPEHHIVAAPAAYIRPRGLGLCS